jgi:hypothetical protein
MLEQYYIHKYQYINKLISEQNSGEHNPVFEIAFNLQQQYGSQLHFWFMLKRYVKKACT